MQRTYLDRVAQAVLYEGYILYPYRPCVKNRHRWTFGGLCPQVVAEVQESAGAWSMQTQCLVAGPAETRVEVIVRFLHLTARTVGKIDPPLDGWPADGAPAFQLVDSLRVGGRLFQTWQEATEQTVPVGEFSLAALQAAPRRYKFTFPASRTIEPLTDHDHELVGVVVRQHEAISGMVTASVEPAADGLFRLTIRIENHTAMSEPATAARDAVLLRSLVSTHTLLGVSGGEFVSLLEPPEPWHAAALECKNIGTYPVLVGEEGTRDTLLSSPIILYDYPQIAPESNGDLFDGTEIDEILTLRILTLTDEEKEAACAVDERARQLLARTQSLAQEQLLGLHGTLRNVRLSPPEGQHP